VTVSPSGTDPVHLRIEVAGESPELHLHCSGELDLHTSPALTAHLRQAADAGAERIVVGCREVDFVDSAGLRAILIAHRELGAAGVRVVIADPSPPVARVLDMTNLRRTLSE
jgi:stage II sporulation protein AA (anti-sigma F factor antagonist)